MMMLQRLKLSVKVTAGTITRRVRPGVINIHCIDPNNIGDRACTPFAYFEADKPVYTMNFWDVDRGALPSPAHSPVVLGGGGLFYAPEAIQRLLTHHRGPVIAWGIGRNSIKPDSQPDYVGVEKFALFGVRDWDSGHEWVPCASCASPLFDQFRPSSPIHPVVVYEHHANPLGITEFPVFANDALALEDALRFLASGETVITNSYHGVYWAQLLGRKVLTIPFSSRFTAFRFRPTLSTTDCWRGDLSKAVAYPEALDVCRERTSDFAQKVEVRIGVKLRMKPGA